MAGSFDGVGAIKSVVQKGHAHEVALSEAVCLVLEHWSYSHLLFILY